jgi:hypothetical protein
VCLCGAFWEFCEQLVGSALLCIDSTKPGILHVKPPAPLFDCSRFGHVSTSPACTFCLHAAHFFTPTPLRLLSAVVVCTQANSEARKVIAEKWRSGGSDSTPGSPTGSSSKDLSDTGVFVELPQLADEVWVTEDELARLFLVTSEMTNVLKVGGWASS